MARIFLDANESRNGAFANNDIVFGSTGTETVAINNGATNVRVEGTVEVVTLAGIPSDFTYRAEGNNLVVFRGSAQVARIIVQDDASGTVINFTNGSASANVGAGGLTLGGTAVTGTQGTVNPTITPIDNTPQLTAAIQGLTAAQAASTAAIRAAAVADNADRTDGDATLAADTAAYRTFVNNYTAANASTELSGARNRLFTEQQEALQANQNLASARATTSDAALQQNLTNALAAPAVRDDAVAQTTLQNRATANANLQSDVAADGSNQQVLASLRTAIANYVSANGDTTVSVSAGVTVADVLAQVNGILNAATVDQAQVDAAVNRIGGYDFPTPAANASAATVALDRAFIVVDDRDNLIDSAAAAENAVDNLAALDGVQAAEDAIAARGALVQTAETEQAQVATAQAYFDNFSAIVGNINTATQSVTSAQGTFTTLGYERPVTVGGGAAVSGTIGDDVFLVDVTAETGTVNAFSTLGDDVLYVGQGYSVVNVASNVNVETAAVGSATGLEVFVKQVGSDTLLYVEEAAFNGSETDTTFDGAIITLTNVTAANVSFANGFFTIA